MGCFTVLKSRKKKHEQVGSVKRVAPKGQTPTTLPLPQQQTRTLQSAPPSFKARVKPVQPVNLVTSSRTRVKSAPSSLDAAEKDALSSAFEYEEREEPKIAVGLVKEQRPPSPQPLPLPSPQSTATLKAMSSFKSSTGSSPLFASGPLPLPPTGPVGTPHNFSYEEIAAACHNFSSDRCISEGLSSLIYRASFGDDASCSKKFEATVTRLSPSAQVAFVFLLFSYRCTIHANDIVHHVNLLSLVHYDKRKSNLAIF